MDTTIALFLIQDGIANGAIYALLGLALVLIFAVTRVIFIPQGEFVAYGAMTYCLLESGKVPGTAWLLALFGAAACAFELLSRRRHLTSAVIASSTAKTLALPFAVLLIVHWLAPTTPGIAINFLLTLAIVVPMGPYLYRFAFQPLADASILTLLIASVGIHLAMMGLGLVFFGAEGQRAQAFFSATLTLGPMIVSSQSIAVYLVTLALIVGLYLFFERSLYGKALHATAVNRLGARLVGVRTSLSGQIAFGLAATIGAVSGVLIAPFTTLYYDAGFLIGLKGFVAAIIGGLVSYPLTAVSALVVGIVEAFGAFAASGVKEIVVFTLIIPVLIWRSLRSLHIEEED